MGKYFGDYYLSNEPQHSTEEYFQKGLTITQFKGEPHQLKEYQKFICKKNFLGKGANGKVYSIDIKGKKFALKEIKLKTFFEFAL